MRAGKSGLAIEGCGAFLPWIGRVSSKTYRNQIRSTSNTAKRAGIMLTRRHFVATSLAMFSQPIANAAMAAAFVDYYRNKTN